MEQVFCKKCDSDKNYEEVKKNLNFCPDCNADLSAGIKPTSPKPTSPKPTETEHSHQYNAGKYLIKRDKLAIFKSNYDPRPGRKHLGTLL